VVVFVELCGQKWRKLAKLGEVGGGGGVGPDVRAMGRMSGSRAGCPAAGFRGDRDLVDMKMGRKFWAKFGGFCGWKLWHPGPEKPELPVFQPRDEVFWNTAVLA
jgi:hypothetical protein